MWHWTAESRDSRLLEIGMCLGNVSLAQFPLAQVQLVHVTHPKNMKILLSQGGFTKKWSVRQGS